MNIVKSFFVFLFLGFGITSTHAQEFSDTVKRFITVDNAHFAITNVTVIDGTGNTIKENQTLIIKDQRIEAIGNTASMTLPSDLKQIDGTGKTVIPGLVMLHEHMF